MPRLACASRNSAEARPYHANLGMGPPSACSHHFQYAPLGDVGPARPVLVSGNDVTPGCWTLAASRRIGKWHDGDGSIQHHPLDGASRHEHWLGDATNSEAKPSLGHREDERENTDAAEKAIWRRPSRIRGERDRHRVQPDEAAHGEQRMAGGQEETISHRERSRKAGVSR